MADNQMIRAQRYLEDYQLLVKERDALQAAKDNLHTAAVRADPDGNPNVKAPGEDAVQMAMDHVGEAIAVRLALLARMEDEQHKLVLIMRYINGWTWEVIQRQLCYCRSHIFKYHRDALEAFAEILKG